MESFNFELDQEIDFDLPMNIDGFDLEFGNLDTAVKSSVSPVMRYPRPPEYSVKYEHAVDMVKATPDLQPGEAIYAIVSGNFIFGEYIEALMVEKNYFAEEMVIATLSIGQENVDSLNNLVQGGYIGKLSMIVSDFWYAHERRKGGGVPYIMETLGGDNFNLAVAGLHTKITLIKTSCGKHLVMCGSANLRSSRNIEQFTIENNENLYNFNAGWTAKILEHYSATKKSLRGGKLWQIL